MISAGGQAPNKVSIYVNASRSKLDTKRFSELLKCIVNTHINPYKDSVTGEQKKSLVILKFDVSSNILDDNAIAKLVGFCRQHAAYLSIKSLKLYQNHIGDAGALALADLIAREDGPTFHELHLSHNRLTTKGALGLLTSLANCSRYPYGKHQDRRSTPLWLRLEHNFICAGDCLSLLEQLKLPVCHVASKGAICTPSNCKTDNAKLHLVYLNFQYWNESLESAKRAVEGLRAAKPSKSISDSQTASQPIDTNADPQSSASVSTKNEQSGLAEVSGAVGSNKDHEIVAGPLYLFMDTNAVVTAVLEPEHPWSFKNLKSRFGNAGSDRAGSSDAASGPSSTDKSHSSSLRSEKNNDRSIEKRVVLVVTDTVLGELDGMSKKKILKSAIVNEMLLEAEKSGYLMMLGAHQGEKLVHALDTSGGIGLDVTTNNDRMIVDIALMFAEALGDPQYAMFISEDNNARLTARNRGLCAISMSHIQVILGKKGKKQPWSSDNLRQWFLAAAPAKSWGEGNSVATSNPLAQLRSVKSTIVSARTLLKELTVSPEQADQHSQISLLLEQAIDSLQGIALLPGLAAKAPSTPSSKPTNTIGTPGPSNAEIVVSAGLDADPEETTAESTLVQPQNDSNVTEDEIVQSDTSSSTPEPTSSSL
jgi:hypothetical protein